MQTKQSGAQSTATGTRGTYKEQCDQILRRRRRIQQAIDAERPHNQKDAGGVNNTALRKRVGLPADKAMS